MVSDTPIGQLHCAAGTIDDHGRLSDRSALKHLGWLAGQRISFQGDHQFIVAQPARHARWSIGRTGYLFIPAAFRHRCNINPGDRVMIAAAPAHDLLLVMPAAVVAAVLWAYRPEVWLKPA
ncbi:AbrB/MazE/SpoVT family DNA-binding domain-containing protein [Nocardia amikacinitolerans]|uniref:AbrB/MazE/SpoVT family DNA-binding domain-containing protein n=1 Tax=Nocardia amikacinitolerans TaxID=756689 RepID=UPI0012ED962D|nr:AbrB/MazE/SpoVT family DNA-binding domain-containing protein [Nocardia amikacinitolerans]